MARYLLVFDADCGPCQKFRRAIDFLDQYDRLEYASLAEADERCLLTAIPESRRHRSFHLISPDGRISSGSTAIPSLFSLLPLGNLASSFIRKAPKGQRAIDFVYTAFSRLRKGDSCSYKKESSLLRLA